MYSTILQITNKLSGETSYLCLWNYRYKQHIVKHNSIVYFINAYFLHCFFQRHVSALVMSHLQVVFFTFFVVFSTVHHSIELFH